MKASTAYRDQVLRESLLVHGLHVLDKIHTRTLPLPSGVDGDEKYFLDVMNEMAPQIEKLQEIERMLRGYAAEKRT